MLLYSAAATGGVLTMGLAVTNGLFLSALPSNAVPFVFILPGLTITPAILAYNRVAHRFSLGRLILGSNAFLLACVLAFRVLLETALGQSFVVLASLFLFVELAYTLVLLQFWTVAGQILDARQAKRLFGLIALGGTAANVVVGACMGAIALVIGVKNLLLVVAGSLAVCMFCAVVLSRARADRASTALIHPANLSPGRDAESFPESLARMRHSPLLISILGLTLLVSWLINIGAYQFYMSLQAAFSGRDRELVIFLGQYEMLAGVGAILMQGYFTGWVMRRFGVTTSLLLFPALMGLSGILTLATGGALWAVTLTRAADPVLRRTINTAGIGLLYLPVPPRLRARSRELSEAAYALAFGLLGFLFLWSQSVPEWNAAYWSLPVLVLVLLWGWVLVRARGHYIRALSDNIQRRRLNLAGEPIDLNDRTVVHVLGAALQSPDPLRVVHALELVAQAPALSWDPIVRPLLAHASPEVRTLALRRLGRPGNGAYAAEVETLLGDPDEKVAAAAVQAYAAIQGSAAETSLGPFLQCESAELRGAAILGLMRYGGIEGQRAARQALDQLATGTDPAGRAQAARLHGALAQPDTARLRLLLDDSNLAVARAAIRAAGEIRAPELLPDLLARLEQPGTAALAAQAIGRYGSGIEPALAAAIADFERLPLGRRQIPRILNALGTPEAGQILARNLLDHDDRFRSAVCAALQSLAARGRLKPVAASISPALISELRRAYLLRRVQEDLGPLSPGSLLADALSVRRRMNLERILQLLDILHPAKGVEGVLPAVEAPGPRRAEAVELLDNLLEPQWKGLLPLLEGSPETVREIALRDWQIGSASPAARLAALAAESDDWLRACALFEIGQWYGPERDRRALSSPEHIHLKRVVSDALASRSFLVRETALGASRRFLPPAEFAGSVFRLVRDASFLEQSRYLQDLAKENAAA